MTAPVKHKSNKRMADKGHGSKPEGLQCRIDGMDCPDCAAKIEKVVGEITGVAEVRVDLVFRSCSSRYRRRGQPKRRLVRTARGRRLRAVLPIRP